MGKDRRFSYWRMGLIYGMITFILGTFILVIITNDLSLKVMFWNAVQAAVASLIFVIFMKFFAKSIIKREEEEDK